MWTLLALSCASPAPEPPRVGDPPLDAPATARLETWGEMVADAAAPRHPSDGGGRLIERAGPERTGVGAPIELGVTLEVGPGGVAVGGAIHVVPSPFWGWTPPQGSDPLGPGFTVLTPPDGVALETRSGGGMLVATVGGRALRPGERVRIVYGVGGSARADRFAERAPALSVGVDGDGDGVRALVPGEVEVETGPGPAAALVVTLPSTSAPGGWSILRLAVVDAVGNGFVPFDDLLTLRAGPGLALPPEVRLRPGDHGVLEVPVRAEREGVWVVSVEGPGGLVARSNPLVVRDGATPILWADLHLHSALSDGTGAPEDLFRYARSVAGLDVVAITDHDHWGLRFLDRDPEAWARLQAATEAAQVPGRFVTVHGWEWTSWRHGHRHVLDFDGGPLISSLDPATDTPTGLWAALGERRALTIPHHPAGGPIALDWSVAPDPDHEVVVEIASVHGQSGSPELPGGIYDPVAGAWVEAQWAAGRRFGVIGSTDGHDGHPGLSQLAGGGGGLAALVGAEPTREGVYEALRARRVYATNGPRIVLRFTVDGQPMGSALRAGGPVEVEARVVGTAAIARVELWGRAGPVGSRTGEGALAHAVWTVDPAPGDALWLRVLQQDGGLAWSSPVFFD